MAPDSTHFASFPEVRARAKTAHVMQEPHTSFDPPTFSGDRHRHDGMEATMNWDQIAGEWKQIQAQVKSKWSKLTDDDLKNLDAKKDMLVGKIQKRYGILKDEAERQVDEWVSSVPAETHSHQKRAGQSDKGQ